MPQISIIVPVYNTERFVAACIESLLSQTMHDIEIILVDDGSTDNSREICQRYERKDPRVRLITKENGGAGSARNTGLDAATGTYVGFVDSDDLVTPQMYERLFDAASETDADCARCGHARYLDGKILTCAANTTQLDITGQECADYAVALIGRNRFHPKFDKVNCSVYTGIYRTAIIRSHGIRFMSEREIMSEDTIFNFDFFSVSNSIRIIPDCLYYYRLNEGSISRRLDTNESKKMTAFASCIRSRASSLGDGMDREDMKLRHDNLLISLHMAFMSKAARYCSSSRAVKEIRSVADNEPFRRTFMSHPSRNLTMNQRIIRFLLKHRMVRTIYVCFYMKYIISGCPGDGQ